MQGYLNNVCEKNDNEKYSNYLMIGQIKNWRKNIPREYVEFWSDLKSLQYSFLHLRKLYSFDTRVTKNGDIFIIVSIEGLVKEKEGKPNAIKKGGILEFV